MADAEHGVHNSGAASDCRNNLLAVYDFGHMGGRVAHGVADLLDWHAVLAHDRHGRVPGLVGVPVADARAAGDLAESPVERVAGVRATILVTEHEVVVMPDGSGG